MLVIARSGTLFRLLSYACTETGNCAPCKHATCKQQHMNTACGCYAGNCEARQHTAAGSSCQAVCRCRQGIRQAAEDQDKPHVSTDPQASASISDPSNSCAVSVFHTQHAIKLAATEGVCNSERRVFHSTSSFTCPFTSDVIPVVPNTSSTAPSTVAVLTGKHPTANVV